MTIGPWYISHIFSFNAFFVSISAVLVWLLISPDVSEASSSKSVLLLIPPKSQFIISDAIHNFLDGAPNKFVSKYDVFWNSGYILLSTHIGSVCFVYTPLNDPSLLNKPTMHVLIFSADAVTWFDIISVTEDTMWYCWKGFLFSHQYPPLFPSPIVEPSSIYWYE